MSGSEPHAADHPASENARLALELEERARESEDARACRRLWRASMLGPSIEVCEALLQGDDVPLDRLDPRWVRRFGLR